MKQGEAFPSKRVPWWLPLIGALVCLALGMVSGISTKGGMEWYRSLEKPAGNPPAWVFGPVWTVLYLLMGAAAGRLFARGGWSALGFFSLSFLCNLAWGPAFFMGNWLAGSVAILTAMWIFLFLSIRTAWAVDRVSAGLWVPYLLWITYALYLNVSIAGLNP
ncbi:MAG: TspO/MBR family protein [Luteolibacter sp.]